MKKTAVIILIAIMATAIGTLLVFTPQAEARHISSNHQSQIDTTEGGVNWSGNIGGSFIDREATGFQLPQEDQAVAEDQEQPVANTDTYRDDVTIVIPPQDDDKSYKANAIPQWLVPGLFALALAYALGTLSRK